MVWSSNNHCKVCYHDNDDDDDDDDDNDDDDDDDADDDYDDDYPLALGPLCV